MIGWLGGNAWLAYLGIGAVVGFAAGLLGIGGGMVMVPMLAFIFGAQGIAPELRLHLALGTALATVVFTAMSSVRAHHAYGAVDWRVALAIAPGIVCGAFGAGFLAGLIPARPLAVIFTLLVLSAGTQMLFDLKPRTKRPLPGLPGLFAAGAIIGGISSLLSAGGAFLSIPFLAWCSVPLRRAVGTAAAIGFPIAVAGTAGYVLQGLRAGGLPAWTVGYVYLPALGLIVLTSMLAAPLGARLTHRLPVRRIRFVFAAILYAMAVRMLAAFW